MMILGGGGGGGVNGRKAIWFTQIEVFIEKRGREAAKDGSRLPRSRGWDSPSLGGGGFPLRVDSSFFAFEIGK